MTQQPPAITPLDIQELAESVMADYGWPKNHSSEFYAVRAVTMAVIARALARGDVRIMRTEHAPQGPRTVDQSAQKDGFPKAR